MASKCPHKIAESILHSTYNDVLLDNFILTNKKQTNKQKTEKSPNEVHVFAQLWNIRLGIANKTL